MLRKDHVAARPEQLGTRSPGVDRSANRTARDQLVAACSSASFEHAHESVKLTTAAASYAARRHYIPGSRGNFAYGSRVPLKKN
jgi:hypothetical protein